MRIGNQEVNLLEHKAFKKIRNDSKDVSYKRKRRGMQVILVEEKTGETTYYDSILEASRKLGFSHGYVGKLKKEKIYNKEKTKLYNIYIGG